MTPGRPGDGRIGAGIPSVILVVDVANVMGSRPDGWWRDRAGAATRLVASLVSVRCREVTCPDGSSVVADRIVAVVEGRARGVASPEDVEVVRAPGSGDDTIVEVAADLVGEGRLVAVVTADRGLRARLPEGVRAFGPRWLRDLLDAAGSAAP